MIVFRSGSHELRIQPGESVRLRKLVINKMNPKEITAKTGGINLYRSEFAWTTETLNALIAELTAWKEAYARGHKPKGYSSKSWPDGGIL